MSLENIIIKTYDLENREELTLEDRNKLLKSLRPFLGGELFFEYDLYGVYFGEVLKDIHTQKVINENTTPQEFAREIHSRFPSPIHDFYCLENIEKYIDHAIEKGQVKTPNFNIKNITSQDIRESYLNFETFGAPHVTPMQYLAEFSIVDRIKHTIDKMRDKSSKNIKNNF